jgi:hypothetical protein
MTKTIQFIEVATNQLRTARAASRPPETARDAVAPRAKTFAKGNNHATERFWFRDFGSWAVCDRGATVIDLTPLTISNRFRHLSIAESN